MTLALNFEKLAGKANSLISKINQSHPDLFSKAIQGFERVEGAAAPRAVMSKELGLSFKATDIAKIKTLAQGKIYNDKDAEVAVNAIGHLGDLAWHVPDGELKAGLRELQTESLGLRHHFMQSLSTSRAQPGTKAFALEGLQNESIRAFDELPPASQHSIIDKMSLNQQSRQTLLDPHAVTIGSPNPNKRLIEDFATHIAEHHSSSLPPINKESLKNAISTHNSSQSKGASIQINGHTLNVR